MDNRYEAHITADIKHAELVKAASNATGWKYSQIHGCPIMGDKTYCYLTHYSTNARLLKNQLEAIETLLKMGAVPVLRAKIEQILYDTKTGVNLI